MTAIDHDEYLGRRIFGSLNGLRFLSIVGVVWHHAIGAVDAFEPSGKGFLGVDLFFVISGFLIVTLLLRERDATRDISLSSFYMRRTLRIFPIYYLLLIGLAAIFLFIKPNATMAEPFLRDLPYHLTYTTNWIEAGTFMAIAWSLAAEEQFYLTWPLVEKIGKAVVPVLLVSLLINQAVNFGLLDGPLQEWFGQDRHHSEMLQVTFTPILLGVGLAHLLHDREWFDRLGRWLGARYLPLAILAGLVALCTIPDLTGWPRLCIHLLMTALLATCVLREDHLLAPLLEQPAVARIGVISYGIYLYHHFALIAANAALARSGVEIPGANFVLTLFLSVLVAEVSFRTIERYFLGLKKRWVVAT